MFGADVLAGVLARWREKNAVGGNEWAGPRVCRPGCARRAKARCSRGRKIHNGTQRPITRRRQAPATPDPGFHRAHTRISTPLCFARTPLCAHPCAGTLAPLLAVGGVGRTRRRPRRSSARRDGPARGAPRPHSHSRTIRIDNRVARREPPASPLFRRAGRRVPPHFSLSSLQDYAHRALVRPRGAPGARRRGLRLGCACWAVGGTGPGLRGGRVDARGPGGPLERAQVSSATMPSSFQCGVNQGVTFTIIRCV